MPRIKLGRLKLRSKVVISASKAATRLRLYLAIKRRKDFDIVENIH